MTITVDMLLAAGAIFLLRVLNYAISTIRMVAITRGRRLLASALAFVEAFLFAVVIASIVTDISSNVLNLVAYCLGAAAGGWVGMVLESRFITSYLTVSIIPHIKEAGHAIAVALREGGYGVTETMGEGLEGAVTLIRSVVSKRDMQSVLAITKQVDANAFVSVEETQAIYRGWQKRRTKPGARISET